MPSHFCIRVLSSEGPLDASLLGVAAPLPGIDFRDESGLVWKSSIEALAIQDADLDFSHVEPTGVLRGVVEDDPMQKCLSLFDAEDFFEALAKVGIKVVHDPVDTVSGVIHLFEQVANEGNEIGFGAMRGHPDGAASALGLHGHKQIAGASADLLIILSQRPAGFDRQGQARVFEQLFALFVQTHNGLLGLEGASIEIKQVVHPLPILFRYLADTPHQLAPRLEAVFFSSRRIVSRLIGALPACARAACSSNLSVHRVAPTGGSEQAKAEMCASKFVSYRRGLPGRATSSSA